MGRLLDEYTTNQAVQKVLVNYGFEPCGTIADAVWDAIENVPTAYDPDNVVEQIQKKSIMVATSKEFWDNPQNGEYVEYVVPTQDAIEIIKTGGIE